LPDSARRLPLAGSLGRVIVLASYTSIRTGGILVSGGLGIPEIAIFAEGRSPRLLDRAEYKASCVRKNEEAIINYANSTR